MSIAELTNLAKKASGSSLKHTSLECSISIISEPVSTSTLKSNSLVNRITFKDVKAENICSKSSNSGFKNISTHDNKFSKKRRTPW